MKMKNQKNEDEKSEEMSAFLSRPLAMPVKMRQNKGRLKTLT
jgi:hypothetical protein